MIYHHYLHLTFFSHFQDVQPASFTLEVLPCPGGYTLQQHTSKTDIHVCTCNEEISEVLLCEEDQDTIVIEVTEGRYRSELVPSLLFSHTHPIHTARQVGSVHPYRSGGQLEVLSLSHWLLSLQP